MENEYNNIRQIMKKQSKLSPYDPKKKLRLVIDGARTAGTGFLLIQYVDNKDIKKGIQIIHSGSNVLPLNRKANRRSVMPLIQEVLWRGILLKTKSIFGEVCFKHLQYLERFV